ncbi:MAG: translation initiation factor eIF-2B, partial [Candidatus Aenigmatarchaeota archaeon]
MDRVEQTVQKIKNLEIQGATSIATESLKVLRGVAEEKGFGEKFREASERLKNARPTGVSAHNLIGYVEKEKSMKSIDRAIEYIRNAKERSAEHASERIQDGDVIMTHCHSSTVMETFRKTKEKGKNFKVIVTETEPKLQGLKTAKELVEMDVPIYYIVDSASGLFMWAADSAFVGVDAVRSEGVLNKVGTYLMALAANEDPETEFYV